ncbi:MAG: hypothetical protein R3Y53_06885 [Bacillota bacterium]
MFINSGMSARSPFANAMNIGNNTNARTTSVMQVGAASMKNCNRDTAEISSEGRMSQTNTAIQNLMDRKESIKEQKNEYIDFLAENNIQLESDDAQIENYDAQTDEIDEQIAQLKEIAMLLPVNQKENKTTAIKEPETKEEAQQTELNDIAADKTSLERAEELTSVQRKLEGEANAKETQAENDMKVEDVALERRILDSAIRHKVDPTQVADNMNDPSVRSFVRERDAAIEMRENAQAPIDHKLEDVATLQNKQESIVTAVADQLQEANAEDDSEDMLHLPEEGEEENTGVPNNTTDTKPNVTTPEANEDGAVNPNPSTTPENAETPQVV